jgi:hypothetical protein
MWKPEHRLAADRSGLRYPSDLTDCDETPKGREAFFRLHLWLCLR